MKSRSPEEVQVARLTSLFPWVRSRADRVIRSEPERYADQLVQALERDDATLANDFGRYCLVTLLYFVLPFAAGSTLFWRWFGRIPLMNDIVPTLLVVTILMFPYSFMLWIGHSVRIAGLRRCIVLTLATIHDQRVLGRGLLQLSNGQTWNRDLYPTITAMLEAGANLPEAPALSSLEAKALQDCLRLHDVPLAAAAIRYLGAH